MPKASKRKQRQAMAAIGEQRQSKAAKFPGGTQALGEEAEKVYQTPRGECGFLGCTLGMGEEAGQAYQTPAHLTKIEEIQTRRG